MSLWTEEKSALVKKKKKIISAVIRCLSNFRPFRCLLILWLCNTTSSLTLTNYSYTHILYAHTNSESISRHFFQLLATLHICILAMHSNMHTNCLSLIHTHSFSCTCWISDTQGAPYITSGCGGALREGMEGRQTCCLLCFTRLC